MIIAFLLFMSILILTSQRVCSELPFPQRQYQCNICQKNYDDHLNKIIAPPTIYFIRHGKSTFNIIQDHIFETQKIQQVLYTPQYEDFQFDLKYQDSDLAPSAEMQCLQSRQKMKNINLDLIVVSPLRRALKTADIIFNNHTSNPPIIVDPLFREIFQSGCDIGSLLQETMKVFPHYNYSLIKNPNFWYIETLKNETKKAQFKQLLQMDHQNIEQHHNNIKLKFVQYMKELWYKRRQQPSFISWALSSFEHQKNKLKELLQNHKSIAVVTHSTNLVQYSGVRLKNCQILVYKPHYFQMPVQKIPKMFL